VILAGLCWCISLALADTWQLWRTWRQLRQLLVHLDLLPLRRTLHRLKGLEWVSAWQVSAGGLDERYRVISRQFESIRHLRNTIAQAIEGAPEPNLLKHEFLLSLPLANQISCQMLEPSLPKGEVLESTESKTEIIAEMDVCQAMADAFAKWFVTLPRYKYVSDLTHLRDFQRSMAGTAGYIMRAVLATEWRSETRSLIFEADQSESSGTKPDGAESLEVKDHVRRAEEFFVLPYLAFIQNVLSRIRTMFFGILCVFIAATLSVASYPFDPRPALAGVFLATFLVIGAVLVYVYAQMCRDATLSHITNTNPGELGAGFWLHSLAFGAAPLLGLLTTMFPSITDVVVTWLQPATQAIK
jgi:hypothetical protein